MIIDSARRLFSPINSSPAFPLDKRRPPSLPPFSAFLFFLLLLLLILLLIIFFLILGSFDPYSDDPRLGIQKIALCPMSGTLVVAGTAGQVCRDDLRLSTVYFETER